MNWYQMISTLLQLTQVLELMGVFSDSIMIYFLKPVRKIFSSSNQGPLLTHENWDFVTLSVCRAGRHGWRLTRSLKNTFLMFLEIKLSGNQIFLKRFLAPFSTFSGNAVFQMFCYSHILSKKMIGSISILPLVLETLKKNTCTKKWAIFFFIFQAFLPRLQKNYFGNTFRWLFSWRFLSEKLFDLKIQVKY